VTWNPERYREKRERVLAGNQKQGSGLVKGLLMAVMGVVALGLTLGAPAVWESISFRHLDDVILRVDAAAHTASLLPAGEGILRVAEDHGGSRLVVTFDRRETSAKRIVASLRASGVDCFLLNTMPHSVGERERKEAARESI
jgi:hypothetical protein